MCQVNILTHLCFLFFQTSEAPEAAPLPDFRRAPVDFAEARDRLQFFARPPGGTRIKILDHILPGPRWFPGRKRTGAGQITWQAFITWRSMVTLIAPYEPVQIAQIITHRRFASAFSLRRLASLRAIQSLVWHPPLGDRSNPTMATVDDPWTMIR